MIFTSRYRPLTYVIKPQSDREKGLPYRPDGFKIVFNGTREGTFDSSSIEDEDQRKFAEDFLLNHRDRGTYFHVTEEPQLDAALGVCIGTIDEPGQSSRICGKTAQAGSDYCAECSQVLVD